MRERGGGGTVLRATNDGFFLLAVGVKCEVDKVNSCEEFEGFTCCKTLFFRSFMNWMGLGASE